MFGFFKRRKKELAARTLIKIELQGQINSAFDQNPDLASKRFSTSFCVGYVWYFVRIGFTNITKESGELAAEKHLRYILHSEYFNDQLWDVFFRQLSAIEMAKTLPDQDRKMVGLDVSPSEMVKLFGEGGNAGMADALHICGHSSYLKYYLLDELDLSAIPRV